MTPIIYTDEVLLYGLARYFGIRRGTKRSSACLAVASLLLTLYRVKGPAHRHILMQIAGLSHNSDITFRTYIHTLRGVLGQEALYFNEHFQWQLSFEGRKQVDEAFIFITKELDEAMHPTRPVTLAVVRAEKVA